MPVIYNAAATDIQAFLTDIDALVMGSPTYQWLLDALDSPQHLPTQYGDRPIWVFTSRDLPVPPDTHVRLLNGPVTENLPLIRDTAETIWVMGGGDLVGQFFDAGALVRIILTMAPVFLPAGRPTLPRLIDSSRLTLAGHRELGQFVELTYDVK